MSGLINAFAFSFSSYQEFKTCNRRWALHRIQAWNGWLREAPEERRLAYRLSKMRNYAALAGDLVHQQIEDVVDRIVTEPSTAIARFRIAWQASLADSKSEAWRRIGPKKAPPLFEHYYGCADQNRAARTVARATRCLENVFTLPELEDIKSADRLQMEELESFQLGPELKVWAKPDLAFWHSDERLRIWDHKTGREREHDAVQVLLYALWAIHRWGADPGAIRLFLSCLHEPSVEEVPVAPGALEHLEHLIRTGAAEMRSRLPNPAVIDGDLQDFRADVGS